jgi:hypothetical protein
MLVLQNLKKVDLYIEKSQFYVNDIAYLLKHLKSVETLNVLHRIDIFFKGMKKKKKSKIKTFTVELYK